MFTPQRIKEHTVVKLNIHYGSLRKYESMQRSQMNNLANLILNSAGIPRY